MNPLILFNCLISANNFNINNNSQFFINHRIDFEWNNNISFEPLYLFLTHNDPPIISKYSNHSIVLSKDVTSSGNSTYWTPPDILNSYDTNNILWRFMLTNTESPHMGTISSNSHNPVFLSNYFYLKSDMNVSLNYYPYDSGYLDTNITTEINNFNTFNISLYLENEQNQIYLIDSIADTQISSYSTGSSLILHDNSIFILSNEFYDILNNIPDSQLSTNYTKIFVSIDTYRYDTVLTRQSNRINLDYMYARLQLNINNVVLNNWCFKRIGSCNYDIYFTNTFLDQQNIYENRTNVTNIFGYNDILGNLTIYTQSENLQSNLIFNEYLTTTATTTPTSTITTTATTTATTTPTSNFTVITSTLSHTSITSTYSSTSIYEPFGIINNTSSNNTYVNCSTCNNNNESNERDGFWIFILIILILCSIGIIIAISTYIYYKFKDDCGDNLVHPSDENSNSPISNNINVTVDNSSSCTSPIQSFQRTNSFFLVKSNRVLQNNIYSSTPNNSRLHNNSLYSYSYTYPRNPVYQTPNESPTETSDNNTTPNQYNVLNPNYHYPRSQPQQDPDTPRYNVLIPRTVNYQ